MSNYKIFNMFHYKDNNYLNQLNAQTNILNKYRQANCYQMIRYKVKIILLNKKAIHNINFDIENKLDLNI